MGQWQRSAICSVSLPTLSIGESALAGARDVSQWLLLYLSIWFEPLNSSSLQKQTGCCVLVKGEPALMGVVSFGLLSHLCLLKLLSLLSLLSL